MIVILSLIFGVFIDVLLIWLIVFLPLRIARWVAYRLTVQYMLDNEKPVSRIRSGVAVLLLAVATPYALSSGFIAGTGILNAFSRPFTLASAIEVAIDLGVLWFLFFECGQLITLLIDMVRLFWRGPRWVHELLERAKKETEGADSW
ncbi:MAG: hypothetical protein OXE05_04310 [Chloroflexi bacterium]|nr:hypothetical protein [Chloroflexota bacterium]